MADSEGAGSRGRLLSEDEEPAHSEVGASEQEGSTVMSFTLLCTIFAAFGPLAFGYTLGYTSPALSEMRNELHLSTGQASFFSAIVNVGAMVGAISGGSIADRLGRKKALLVAGVPFAVGWAVIAFSSEIVLLSAGRFLCGFGTGMVSFAVPVYIAEIAPVELRGSLGALNQLAITIGILLVYTLGLVLGWRSLAITGIVPPVLLLISLTIIPETPRWVAKHSTSAELAVVLHKLRGRNANIAPEMRKIQAAVEEADSQPQATLKDLAGRSLRMPLLVGVGLMVLQQFSGVNSVMFYAGSIFAAAGFENPNLPGFFLQAVQVVMSAVAAGLMDKAGRRLLLILSASGLATAAFTLGLSFLLKDLPDDSPFKSISGFLALASLMLYIIAFATGMGPIPWIIMSEIFPTYARGLAGSIAVLTNWLSSFVVTLTFYYLVSWSSVGAFWLYAAESVIAVVFVLFLVPETRGRSLEEIEAFFRTSF